MNHYPTTVSPADVAGPNDLLTEVTTWPECWRVLRRVRKEHDHRVQPCTCLDLPSTRELQVRRPMCRPASLIRRIRVGFVSQNRSRSATSILASRAPSAPQGLPLAGS